MDVWRDIRKRAQQRSREASALAEQNSASALAKAGLKAAQLGLSTFQPGTIYGAGVLGALEREDCFVRLSTALTPQQVPVVTAHEIGHWWLHDDPSYMVRSTEAGFGGDPFETGSERVTAYSPRERKEVQADVFAQEFLLPADHLRERLVRERKKPSDIALELGLPLEFVRMQAIRALLLPPLDDTAVLERKSSAVPLDDDQRVAAEWDGRPLLLDAGPGTGKTRTLIARIGHLLSQDVPASSILALTFSNKAASEMIERVETLDAEETPLIWIGTFHAFGLELLRLHGAGIGLTAGFEILDEAGSLALLEAKLADLDLDYYQNLWDPSFELRSMLRAISRAKDEMVSVAEYASAAEDMVNAAVEMDDVIRAGKAREVARVYRIYEETLEQRNCVDFGDLVYKSVRLLRGNPSILQQVRQKHRHVLVDEYQDVNQASTDLLDLLAEGGRNIWAVADPRQSIYRFRGAAPSNAADFTTRYAAAEARRLQLGTNYRSCETVVRVFERFGASIAAAPKPATTWVAFRGRTGSVKRIDAPDLRSEAAALRDEIESLRASGYGYGGQAILARTHLCLARFGKLLQEFGVPVLYLGDLFERPEIRDLLSLVSLGADPSGVGLVRVAQFEEYGATRADAVRVIAEADDSGEDILTALKRVDAIEGLTDRGREGLALLSTHLAGVEWKMTAWTLLTRYLLEDGGYLLRLVDKDDIRSQQSLIAIYQLLKFSREHHEKQNGRGGRRTFLDAIRRLEKLNDDKAFRAVPPEADGVPAVRMMTIHASKGLEFPAVHLPQVASRHVPQGKKPVPCPAPIGLEKLETSKAAHDSEEECLFFVALSRAQDKLSVFSAKTYTGNQNCSPSKFLDRLPGVMPSAVTVNLVSPLAPSAALHPVAGKTDFEDWEVDIYLRCPARYRYEVVEGLGGAAERSPFLRFHGIVRKAIRWLCERASEGIATNPGEAAAYLGSIWAESRLDGYAFEAVYAKQAERLVRSAAANIAPGAGDLGRDWSAQVAGNRIHFTPDRVFEDADGAVVAQRFKTGRKGKSEHENAIWALMRAAGPEMFPGRRVRLQAFYAALSEAVEISGDLKALDKYVSAIDGIKRGAFEPKPKDTRDCPGCPMYFICTREDG